MDEKLIYEIYETSARHIRQISTAFHRSLYDKINWSARLIALKGARGTGKTTLILQRLKEAYPADTKVLYLSLDNLWFTLYSVVELARYHVNHGGTHLFLDEVHYLPEWQRLVKNLYDDYPELSIVYTGSSMLKMERGQGDLSRRQLTYELTGLSFREYLEFEGLGHWSSLRLEELLSSHVKLATDVSTTIKPLYYFERYLTSGYYPFYREGLDGYDMRIRQVVNQVLENDYPAIDEVEPGTIRKAKKMMMILSARPPQTPNLSQLARELEVDWTQGLKMLQALERAGLLNLLESESASLKNMSRPDKIYCENTNLMYALVPTVERGTLRECYFCNQLKAVSQVNYPKQGDFLVNGKYLFEVGGHGKKYTQIADIPNSYLAVDDLEIGHGNRIPLWCFGFLL